MTLQGADSLGTFVANAENKLSKTDMVEQEFLF